MRCIVNPAPALPADLASLAAVDYFIPNETEAETLTGLPVKTLDDAQACAAALLAKGFRRVVLTLGARGSLIAGTEGSVHVPAFAVTAIDTTGAGDAFIGSLATLLAEGLPEKDAVTGANLYAALSTRRVGTQKSFPDRAAFDAERAKR
jgi:ribokinase